MSYTEYKSSTATTTTDLVQKVRMVLHGSCYHLKGNGWTAGKALDIHADDPERVAQFCEAFVRNLDAKFDDDNGVPVAVQKAAFKLFAERSKCPKLCAAMVRHMFGG